MQLISKDRAAVTLIELLVALAIIGVLAALILPAVNSAREVSRNIECRSHLRQNALAVYSFVHAKGALPPGYEFSVDANTKIGNNGAVVNGFFTLILPFLEQDIIENKYDYRQGYDHLTNQPAVRTKVPTFQCPSVGGNRMMKMYNNLAAFAGGIADQGRTGQAADYFGVRIYTDDLTRRYKGVFRAVFPPSGGFFEPEEPMQLSGISDGLANTLLMVEIAGRPNRYTRKKNLGVQNYYAGTWAGVNGEMIYAIEERVTIAPSAGTCIINCNNFYTPFSFHRGSVNASYCDGSVHSVSETIDKIAWKQLVQPDDNELRETE